MGKRIYKITAWLVLAVLVHTAFSGYTRADGFGYIYLDREYKVYDGVSFHELLGTNPSVGPERAYYVSGDVSEGGAFPIVYNGSVRSTSKLSDYVRYAEEQGYRVLAAINGDVFDMSSGCPKNPVIHEYSLVTSGYAPDRVICFDGNGRASMKSAAISFTLKGRIAYDYLPEEGAEIQRIEEDWTGYPLFFNVPQGSYDGITIYSPHYAGSTLTTGSRVEVLLDFEEAPQLGIGKSIRGLVSEIRSETANSFFSDRQLVLSANYGTQAGNELSALIPGSEVEITVGDAGGSGLGEAKEAVGLYYSLVEDGRLVTNGSNVNPRSVLGIREDGSLLLYVVDGRQNSSSRGLSLVDAAKHMLALGCTEAFNLDGGGSSAIYAKIAGFDENAVLKNNPSGGSERKVANAILLVCPKNASSSELSHLNLMADNYFAMPGAVLNFSAYGADDAYEKIGRAYGAVYSAEGGEIDENGRFVAGSESGEFTVSAASGRAEGKINICIADEFSIFPNLGTLLLEAGESADIDVRAKIGAIELAGSDELFEWTCSEGIGSIDKSGVFTAAEKAVGGIAGSIEVSFRENRLSIPVTVGARILDFDDTLEHWAREYIGELAALGVVNGMAVKDANVFAPDAPLTRAQFLAMLAKTQNADINVEEYDGFTDVPSYEWYYHYVAWGYQNGIVKGVNAEHFAPDAPITREQICVMLANFERYLGNELEEKTTMPAFWDTEEISEWALEHVERAAKARIVNGMPDGSFAPLEGATRAQAAKVVYMLEKDGLTDMNEDALREEDEEDEEGEADEDDAGEAERSYGEERENEEK